MNNAKAQRRKERKVAKTQREIESSEDSCYVCGCTEFNACMTPAGPCHWVKRNLCSAPACVAADARRSATKRLPTLPRKLAGEISPRLQVALDYVGECIDELHSHGSATGPKRSWLLLIDEVQEKLVALTCAANACRRKA